MLRIHAAQAQHGDALLLEHETVGGRRFVLVDGGTRHTLNPYLRRALNNRVVPNGGKLDLVAVSHVDRDHVDGILDLFVELRSERDEGHQPFLEIEGIWHNSFGEDISDGTDIEPRLADVLTVMSTLRGTQALGMRAERAFSLAQRALQGIRDGAALQREARLLGVPRNEQFQGEAIVASGDPQQDTMPVGGLELRIVGPTRRNLRELQLEWQHWLAEREQEARDGQLDVAAMSDKSVPNLASLQLLVSAERNGYERTALLTGDGRGDHLLEALEAGGLLDSEGGIDVDLLKVPHHGSDRNVTPEWFERVRAKQYLISGDGTVGGNPDLSTLRWIVDAAKRQGRRIELLCTNRTENTRKLMQQRPSAENGYRIRFRRQNWKYLTVTV